MPAWEIDPWTNTPLLHPTPCRPPAGISRRTHHCPPIPLGSCGACCCNFRRNGILIRRSTGTSNFRISFVQA